MFGKSDMRRHISSVHTKNSERKYKCNFCPKGFGTSQSLRDHTNLHTGNRPYVCKLCGATFASFGNHRMHERGHMGHKRRKDMEIKSSVV